MFDRKITVQGIERWLNALELAGILLLLVMAFTFQFVLHELPCPLCLLQRVGFLIISVGFLLNLRFGLRPSHYALSLLGALFTAFVALRQMSLHIVPGSDSYGSSIFGLHMYTWSFIVSMLIVIFTTIILGFDIQYLKAEPAPKCFKPIVHILFILLLGMAIMNFISVLVECGLNECPDNPTHYLWQRV